MIAGITYSNRHFGDLVDYDELYSFEAPSLDLPDTDTDTDGGSKQGRQGQQGQNLQSQLQNFKPKGYPKRTPKLKNSKTTNDNNSSTTNTVKNTAVTSSNLNLNLADKAKQAIATATAATTAENLAIKADRTTATTGGNSEGNNNDNDNDDDDDDYDNDSGQPLLQNSNIGNIPVFYNLFVKNEEDAPRVMDIVKEQFKKSLPGVHYPIYVNSIGTHLDFNSNYGSGDGSDATNTKPLNTTERPIEILGRYETADEHVTLKALWDYCVKPQNKHKKVVYLHSKGSFTNSQNNGKLRRFLTAGALSKECATIGSNASKKGTGNSYSCNMCSSRFSPVPHPHTSGNMWLAKCSYVKKLIDPEQFEAAMESLEHDDGEEFLACDGRGRYSAEHWVHSHPSVKPCDLYTDPSFTWNYDGIPAVKQFKKNLKLQAVPRFDLETYVKTDISYCRGRGASQKFRIDEYKGLIL